jgi:hypothetical protein
MGYHELDLPPWMTAYWVFILGYSWNLVNNFFFKSLKIFKIFITLLCYDLHQKFAKNMSLPEKFKPI